MPDIGHASMPVIPTFKGLENDLKRGTSKALTSAGVSGGTKFGDSAGRSAGSRFGSVFKSAAKVGLIGLAGVVAGAVKLGSDALDEATESLKVGRLTAAVIKSTGGAAKVSQKDVEKLSGRLSYMAGIDDELVQTGANVLLTFKGVRNEVGKGNKIFDRGAKVALNMSKALGTDLKGASIQVGKALGDPVKGVAALARVGVVFTKQQKAQIKALVEGGDANAAMALGLIDSTTTYNNLLKANGDDTQKVARILKSELNPEQQKAFDMYGEGNHTLEAQKRILKELGSEFGGAARSQATASDRMKVAFGNVSEKLGKGLLPLVQDFSRFLLRKGVPAAEKLTDWVVDKGIPKMKELGEKLQPLADELLPAAADAFDKIRRFAGKALPKVEDLVGAFNDMPPWVKNILIGGAVGGLAAKKLGLGGLLGSSKGGTSSGSGILGLVTKTKPLPVFVVNNTGGLGGGLGGGGPKGPKITKLAALGFLGTLGLDLGIGAGVTLGTGHVLDKSGDASLLNAGSGGSGGIGSGDFFAGLSSEDRRNAEAAAAAEKQRLADLAGFRDLLLKPLGKNALAKAGDDTTAAFGRSLNKAGELKLFIDRDVPKTVDVAFHLFGIDIAKQEINGMFDLFIARNNFRRDQFAGDSANTSPAGHPQGPTTSRTTGRGVNVNIYGDVRPHDSTEFFGDLQRRSAAAALDGWRK